ncbi:AsmA family protein [uncultured Cohaesibacter sp.]|uniref:AsmA family protein n=1 Tax=uncultured Cohaesibacter sp. TaxID=1002546 RepID=UPI0029C6190B|nr:AsmA family protein [uncultured Cohaesibacter sp.]
MKPTTRIRILWAILAFLAIAVGLAAASPYLINTRVAKKEISKQISDWVGLPVRVRGETVMTVFPYLTVKLKQVEVQSSLGPGEPPLVSMDTLRAEMYWLPLLFGNFEVRRFNLDKPIFEFARNKDGKSSWDMTGGSIVAPASDSGRLTLAENITLGSFRIAGGKLHFRDEASDRDESLSDIALTFEWPSTEERATVKGSFNWRDEPISLSAKSDKPTELFGGSLSPLSVEVKAPLFEVKGDGTAGTMANLQLEGDFSFKTPSLRDFMSWLDVTPIPGDGLGEASLTARANFAGESVAFSNMSLMLDKNRADGAVQLDFRRDRALIQGTLAGDELDLSPYLVAREEGGSPLDQPLTPDDLGRADLDIRLSASKLTLGNLHFGRTAVALVTRDKQLSFSLGEAFVYGGRIEASLDMRPAKADPRRVSAHLRGKANGLLAGTFSREVLQRDFMTGTTVAEVDLQGEGRNLRELAHAAQGSLSVVLTDGELSRFDLNGFQDALELNDDIDATALLSRNSKFDVLSIRGRMIDNAIGVEGLRLTSGNRAIMGTADLDFNDMTLNFPGTLALYRNADPASQSTEDPVQQFNFRLSGPLMNPVLKRRAKTDGNGVGEPEIRVPGVPTMQQSETQKPEIDDKSASDLKPATDEGVKDAPAVPPSSTQPGPVAGPDAPVEISPQPTTPQPAAAPKVDQDKKTSLEQSVGDAARRTLEKLLSPSEIEPPTGESVQQASGDLSLTKSFRLSG